MSLRSTRCVLTCFLTLHMYLAMRMPSHCSLYFYNMKCLATPLYAITIIASNTCPNKYRPEAANKDHTDTATLGMNRVPALLYLSPLTTFGTLWCIPKIRFVYMCMALNIMIGSIASCSAACALNTSSARARCA